MSRPVIGLCAAAAIVLLGAVALWIGLSVGADQTPSSPVVASGATKPKPKPQDPAADGALPSSLAGNELRPLTAKEQPEPARTDKLEQPDAPPQEQLADLVQRFRSIMNGAQHELKEHRSEIEQTYLAIQGFGQPGFEAAASLFVTLEKRFGLGSGETLSVEAFWGSVATYMKLFTPAFVTYMVEFRGEFNQEACGLVIMQNISYKADWATPERLKLVIGQLETQGTGELPEYRRMAAIQALLRLPCPEAAAAAAKLVHSGAEPWVARHDAVWALARVGRDEDFDVIRWVELNDKEPRVRETAEFHRLARGVTEPGFLIKSIDADGTAVGTMLKPGDIVRWAADVEFKFAAQIPEAFSDDQPLTVTRQGQPFDVVLPKGAHGLRFARVPPNFPD